MLKNYFKIAIRNLGKNKMFVIIRTYHIEMNLLLLIISGLAFLVIPIATVGAKGCKAAKAASMNPINALRNAFYQLVGNNHLRAIRKRFFKEYKKRNISFV